MGAFLHTILRLGIHHLPNDLTSKLFPRKYGGIPFDVITINTGTFLYELGPHIHKESIEDIEGLVVFGQESTIESTSQLDDFILLFGLSPNFIELLGINVAKSLTGLEGIGGLVLLEYFGPGLLELGLEFVVGHWDFVGRKNGGFGGNGVVVLIDEFLSIDLFGLDFDLGLNGNSRLEEGFLDEPSSGRGIGMRFDKHQCGIEESRATTATAAIFSTTCGSDSSDEQVNEEEEETWESHRDDVGVCCTVVCDE
jgi:hypothetical protein